MNGTDVGRSSNQLLGKIAGKTFDRLISPLFSPLSLLRLFLLLFLFFSFFSFSLQRLNESSRRWHRQNSSSNGERSLFGSSNPLHLAGESTWWYLQRDLPILDAVKILFMNAITIVLHSSFDMHGVTGAMS